MDINNVPKICFKQGSSGEISELIKDLGDNILIVTMKELLDLNLLKPMIENLSASAGEELNGLVQRYNLYLSKPRQVIVDGTSVKPD